jgi:hypothetical protein
MVDKACSEDREEHERLVRSSALRGRTDILSQVCLVWPIKFSNSALLRGSPRAIHLVRNAMARPIAPALSPRRAKITPRSSIRYNLLRVDLGALVSLLYVVREFYFPVRAQ